MRRYVRRTLALALAFALALALLPAGAVAILGYHFSHMHQGQTLRYEVTSENPNTAKVIPANWGQAYKGTFVIPATVTNTETGGQIYKVTAIGAYAFHDTQDSGNNIKGVQIPESVTHIEEAAFLSATATSIKLPTGLRTLGAQAFEGVRIYTITVPGGVQVIGERAFTSCPNLTRATLEPGVETIGRQAFMSCSELTRIDIPKTVKTIEAQAFEACKKLAGITLPYGLETLGAQAFKMNPWQPPKPGVPADNVLSSVTLPDTVISIGQDAFSNCDLLLGVTLEVGGTTTVEPRGYTTGDGTEVTLPNGKPVTKVKLRPEGRVVNNTGKDLPVELPNGESITLPHGKSYPVDPGENKVTGVTEGATYTRGTRLDFTVAGAGMGNTAPAEFVDTRYLPVDWEVDGASQRGAFPAEGPYGGVLDTSGLAPGPHTLLVAFQLQRYNGAAWEPVPGTDGLRKEINFTVVSPSGGGPTVYSLVVEGGTGTGSYPAGHVVTIRANGGAPFSQWVLRSGVGTIGDPYSRETTFTMGSGGAVVTALGAAPPKTGDGPALWLGLALLLLAGGGYALAKRKKA